VKLFRSLKPRLCVVCRFERIGRELSSPDRASTVKHGFTEVVQSGSRQAAAGEGFEKGGGAVDEKLPEGSHGR
jgi:hypothetical protein